MKPKAASRPWHAGDRIGGRRTSRDGRAIAVPGAIPVMVAAAAEEAEEPIPDLGQTALGRNVRVTVRTQGPVSGVIGIDPLNVTLLDILDGWGDLSPEDMKRLELFRPERLAAAVAAVQLPKSTSGEAKARLSQLRQYSADVERKSLAAQAAAAAVALPAAVPDEVAAPVISVTAGPVAIPVAGDAITVVPTGDRTTVSAAPAAVAGAAAATRRSDLRQIPFADHPVKQETSFRELPAPTYQEVEVQVRGEMIHEAPAEVSPNDDEGGAEQLHVYPPLAAVPATDMAQRDAPRTSAPLTSVDTFFWDDPPTDSLSRLSIKVETAEQLLALPPEERADMAAFLAPAELAATFRATEDPELKKAVIDTLEHIGSPASLNALGNCFEDNSCDIQLYALQAADRLLGVTSGPQKLARSCRDR
jgi:hypothetical protein